jgi:hypothetical protein
MVAARPTLFLDTNVCIDVATGAIPAADWTMAKRYISRYFDYRISPHTLAPKARGHRPREGFPAVSRTWSN